MPRRKSKRKEFENLLIKDAGSKGKGIATAPDGKIVFIDQVVPGDEVDVLTYKKRKAYYMAKPTVFHKYSKDRIEPKCIHFGTCGGCKWQHFDYSAQLHYKEKEVLENLKRIGKLEIQTSYPILASDDTYHYRNKMEFSFSNKRWLTQAEINSDEEITQKNALGLHIPGMWDKVLDLKECHLQKRPSNEIRLRLKQYADKKGYSFFDPHEQNGLLRNIMIRTSQTDQVMVVVQFCDDKPEQIRDIMEFLSNEFPQITSLQYIINQKKNDSIYDQDIHLYSGSDRIIEQMQDLQFQIRPKSFYQTNSVQAENLYSRLKELLDLKGDELIFDLYSGIGSIALSLAKNCRKIIGVEVIEDAVKDANENALLNNISNVSFFTGETQDVLNQNFINLHGKPDIIVVDPPREGLHKDVVKMIAAIRPKKLAYVSCNSATQARDLEILKDIYNTKYVQPVDMFPHTYHVENIVIAQS